MLGRSMTGSAGDPVTVAQEAITGTHGSLDYADLATILALVTIITVVGYPSKYVTNVVYFSLHSHPMRWVSDKETGVDYRITHKV